MIAAGALVGLTALGLGGFLYVQSEKSMECTPEVLAQAKTLEVPEALQVAQSCRQAGNLDSTILVLSGLAARDQGSGEAALWLGRLYDPLDPWQSEPGHLTPSIVNAVEFYRQACALKVEGVGPKLAALKSPAEKEAEATGSQILVDLVRNWPQCAP